MLVRVEDDLGLHNEIIYYFLIAGNKKNSCDGALGVVKRELNKRNYYQVYD